MTFRHELAHIGRIARGSAFNAIGPGIIHPASRLPKDCRLAHGGPSLLVSRPPPNMLLIDHAAGGKESEVGLLEFDRIRQGETSPAHRDVLAVGQGDERCDHVLLDERRGIVTIKPAQPHGNGRLIAVFVRQPLSLPDAGLGLIVQKLMPRSM